MKFQSSNCARFPSPLRAGRYTILDARPNFRFLAASSGLNRLAANAGRLRTQDCGTEASAWSRTHAPRQAKEPSSKAQAQTERGGKGQHHRGPQETVG